ncbi:MAG TPA: hypothetical protein VEB66_03665 [Opitutaceae bacterium]|nr:hypothetical protein [Opitutaceae bacterium]
MTIPARRLAAIGFAALAAALPARLPAQGCVIARGGGGACRMDAGLLPAKHWQVSLAYRWFESHRHYAGAEEQTHRDTNGTEVINDSHFADFTATYAWSERLSLSLTIPYVHHDRESLYEHLGNNSGRRFTTRSAGLADVRAGASWWILNPADSPNGNLAVGIGLKAPTGDYRARDVFVRPSGPTERFVDSSIQPGDGGWGFTLELQGYRVLRPGLAAYGSAFYLFNPKDRVAETNFSVPDAYLARAGVDWTVPGLHSLSVSLGGRIEGVPGNDALGGSRGSRRPGFAVAIEPGLALAVGRFTANVTVPVAVHRNRTTTWGSTRAGDAAFADCTVNVGLSWRH